MKVYWIKKICWQVAGEWLVGWSTLLQFSFTVILRIIRQSRVTGVSDVPKYGACHASPSMTDERSGMWHTSKLGNFARIFDFSTLVLLIFILWHSPFSNEMKHSLGMSQSRRGDEQFVILQYTQSKPRLRKFAPKQEFEMGIWNRPQNSRRGPCLPETG